MPLHLRIENETSLADGGPVAITVTSKRGIDIGRDQYLDWVLPDPSRLVSGKHCEIRFRDGRYWLTDVSTNGTFINRSEFRPNGPHALRSGDRIEIGRYIVAVTVEPDPDEAASYQSGNSGDASSSGPVWDVGGDIAPAINPRELRSPSVAVGLNSLDVLDWASDIVPPPPPMLETGGSDWLPAPPRRNPSADADWEASPAPVATHTIEPMPLVPFPAIAPEVQPSLAAQSQPSIHADIQPAAAPRAVPAAAALAPDSEPLRAPEPVRAAARIPPLPQSAEADASLAAQREFLERFAKGAGVPVDVLHIKDNGAFAELLGVVIRNVADNLRQLHQARAKSKGMMRSANQTMVQAMDNNPLRFSPSSEDALRIMFGPQTRSYLDPVKAIESSFDDVKTHQLLTFSAMQTALSKLVEDLDPEKINTSVPAEKGVGSLLSSRKAKLWERYETVWKTKVGTSEHGILDVYMRLFADAYDRSK